MVHTIHFAGIKTSKTYYTASRQDGFKGQVHPDYIRGILLSQDGQGQFIQVTGRAAHKFWQTLGVDLHLKSPFRLLSPVQSFVARLNEGHQIVQRVKKIAHTTPGLQFATALRQALSSG